MKMERSTGFSLVFTNKIYLFGGYTSEKKRTKKIEVYDPEKNFWEILDVKIHRGIEAGFIVSGKPNEILIMGGNV
jgi:N-acetylneuraminic acid mutarotase